DRYYPSETVKLLFAVVDDKGEPVSNADIRLTIETPSGKHYYLSTRDGSIREGRIGTYYAYFNQTFEEGNYSLFAVAIGNDTNNYIYSNFLVEKNITFQFIRKTPIRIDPLLPPFFSTMKIISLKNVSNFTLQEIVPKEFEILSTENVEETDENKVITWYNLTNESSINYSFTVPIKYPYLYEIKARIIYNNKTYEEARKWLMLTDPPASDEYCTWFEEPLSGHAATGGGNDYSFSPNGRCREDTINCYINEIWVHAWASISSQSGASGGIHYVSVSDGSTTVYPWCRNVGNGQECEAYTCVSGGTNRLSTSCGGSACDTGTYPGACDISSGTFTESDIPFTVHLQSSGNGGGMASYKINYTWCGKDTRPHFISPQAIPQSASWGIRRSFNVQVYDKQGDNIKVYLWHRPYGSGAWILANQTGWLSGCTKSSPCTVNLTYTYNCSERAQSNVWEWFFNATDDSTDCNGNACTRNQTWNFEPQDYPVMTITLEKDKDAITLIKPSPNSVINRSSASTKFILYVEDTVLNKPASGTNGKFWISAYSYDQLEEHPVSSNASGYFVKEFTHYDWCGDTTKYYLGIHKWKMGVKDDTCLEDNITDEMNFTLKGSLSNQILLPDGSTNYTQDQAIPLKGIVKDDCNNDVTDATVYFKLIHGTWVYETQVFYSAEKGAYYKEIYLPSDAPTGWYNVSMNSSKSLHWSGYDFKENAFYLKFAPQLENPTVTPQSAGWGRERNFSVNITDRGSDTVTVWLWEEVPAGSGNWIQIGEPKQCSLCNGVILWWTKNYTCADLNNPSRNFKFNATDTEGNIRETTPQAFSIQKDSLAIDYVSGNESTATPLTPAEFVLRARDLDYPTQTIIEDLYLRFNVTTTSWGGPEKYVGNNKTNSNGYVYFYFIPDADFTSGTRRWYGYVDTLLSACYAYNYSDNFTVYVNVNWPPKYRNEKVNGVTEGASAGWATAWTFEIEVKDGEGDDVNVTLYVDSGSGWKEIETKQCLACSDWTKLTFTTKFT
ncbi:MAG: hypothetical protein DRP15_03330, partial [Candidatus Aenigmatarchaeota archaeon]